MTTTETINTEQKTTIICHSPTPAYTAHEDDAELPWDDYSFQCLLIELGQLLTEKTDDTGWLSMRKVSGQSKKHQYELRSRLPTKPSELQFECLLLFSDQCCGDISSGGVKITHRTLHEMTKSPGTYQLRFQKVSSSNPHNFPIL